MTAIVTAIRMGIVAALDTRARRDNRMSVWFFKTATTAALGLAMMTAGYLENATYFVA